MTNLFTAFSDVWAAWGFIQRHQLRKYLWQSLLLNLLVVVVLSIVGWYIASSLTDWLVGLINIPWLEWLIIIVAILLVAFLFYKSYTFIILTVSAPILAALAARTNAILFGKKTEEQGFWAETKRGIMVNVRNTVAELASIIVLLLLSLVPVINVITTPLMFIVSAYFVGVAMMDYRNEYLGYTVKESEQVIRQHRGVALGNGLAYTVLMFIPLVGILLAPSFALVGASITMKKAHKQPA